MGWLRRSGEGTVWPSTNLLFYSDIVVSREDAKDAKLRGQGRLGLYVFAASREAVYNLSQSHISPEGVQTRPGPHAPAQKRIPRSPSDYIQPVLSCDLDERLPDVPDLLLRQSEGVELPDLRGARDDTDDAPLL